MDYYSVICLTFKYIYSFLVEGLSFCKSFRQCKHIDGLNPKKIIFLKVMNILKMMPYDKEVNFEHSIYNAVEWQ